MLTSGYEWSHPPEAREEDFGDFEKELSWVPGSEEEFWLSFAQRSQASGLVAGATRGLGQMEKSV